MPRMILMVMALMMLAAGCESAEEKCNSARVGAHDAWDAIATGLRPLCDDLTTEEWEGARAQGLAAQNGIFSGRGSRQDLAASAEWRAVEPHYARLVEACTGSTRASGQATEAAVGARDSASGAVEAVRALDRESGGVLAAFDGAAPDEQDVIHRNARNLRRAALAGHVTALDALGLGGLVSTAESASSSSWEACQAVDP